MAHYIDADKLTRAIEDKGLDCSFALKMERLDTLALIDELKQEQPQVADVSKMGQTKLDMEAVSFCYDNGINISPRQAKNIARHFYELGINAKKEDK